MLLFLIVVVVVVVVVFSDYIDELISSKQTPKSLHCDMREPVVLTNREFFEEL